MLTSFSAFLLTCLHRATTEWYMLGVLMGPIQQMQMTSCITCPIGGRRESYLWRTMRLSAILKVLKVLHSWPIMWVASNLCSNTLVSVFFLVNPVLKPGNYCRSQNSLGKTCCCFILQWVLSKMITVLSSHLKTACLTTQYLSAYNYHTTFF